MTQSSILKHLNDAKSTHKHWLQRIDHLITGLPVDKDFIPSKAIDCDFGKWIYFEGAKLRSIPSAIKMINSIEHHHNELHISYMHIYKIYFVLPKKRSILHKIFTLNSQSVFKIEQTKAKEYFEYLQQTSVELLALLDILEKRIKETPISEIDKIV